MNKIAQMITVSLVGMACIFVSVPGLQGVAEECLRSTNAPNESFAGEYRIMVLRALPYLVACVAGCFLLLDRKLTNIRFVICLMSTAVLA